jgi:hypothetical protein
LKTEPAQNEEFIKQIWNIAWTHKNNQSQAKIFG